MKERDHAIDIAKGIAILLMILGHCDIYPLLRNFIFSFHMPLFIIFSGYFHTQKPILQVFRKESKRLIKPYIITSVFIVILCFIAQNFELAHKYTIGVIMANGGHPTEKYGSNLPSNGPIWFLTALFWTKIFYTILKSKTNHALFYSYIISTIAFFVGKKYFNLPFGMLVGLCGLVFYAMGDYWKNDKFPYKFFDDKYSLLFALSLWLLFVAKSRFELFTFECRHYPINMLASFIGTYFTYLLSKHLPVILCYCLQIIGRESMLFLCYHTLSFFVFGIISKYILLPNGIIYVGCIRMISISLLSIILPFIHVYAKRKLNI